MTGAQVAASTARPMTVPCRSGVAGTLSSRPAVSVHTSIVLPTAAPAVVILPVRGVPSGTVHRAGAWTRCAGSAGAASSNTAGS